jgi:hypothetical protein
VLAWFILDPSVHAREALLRMLGVMSTIVCLQRLDLIILALTVMVVYLKAYALLAAPLTKHRQPWRAY